MSPPPRALIDRAVGVLGDLVWPSSCAGCAAWGESLCSTCGEALRPGRVTTRPVWLPGITVCSAAHFDGPVRQAITAFKDEGRRDLRGPLAAMLRSAVADAVNSAACRPAAWVVIGAPSSRASTRRRGRFPLGELVADIMSSPGLSAGPPLVVKRRVRDQSGLCRHDRRTNLHGAYGLRSGSALPPRVGLVLVDDVMTTGATLAEARRAVLPLRPQVVVAATIAAAGGSTVMPTGPVVA